MEDFEKAMDRMLGASLIELMIKSDAPKPLRLFVETILAKGCPVDALVCAVLMMGRAIKEEEEQKDQDNLSELLKGLKFDLGGKDDE